MSLWSTFTSSNKSKTVLNPILLTLILNKNLIHAFHSLKMFSKYWHFRIFFYQYWEGKALNQSSTNVWFWWYKEIKIVYLHHGLWLDAQLLQVGSSLRVWYTVMELFYWIFWVGNISLQAMYVILVTNPYLFETICFTVASQYLDLIMPSPS